MTFTNHYYEDIYELNEGLLGDIAKAGFSGIKKIYRTIKPKIKKFNAMKGIIDPANVTEVPCSVVDYLGGLLGADLLKWRSVSKHKNILQKFILSGKETYINDLIVGMIKSNLNDEFKDVFNLSDKWLIVSIDIYKTTNGGAITLIRVSDPYKGKDIGQQIKPSKVDEFTRKLQNQKCFISIIGKAENWFITKTGMRFNQFLNTRRQINDEKWKEDIENMLQSYSVEPEVEEKPKEIKKPKKIEIEKSKEVKLLDGRIIKYDHQDFIQPSEFDKLGYSADRKANLKLRFGDEIDNITNFDTEKINGKIYKFTNGGQASLLHDKKKNKHYIVSDDLGHDVLIMKKIIRS